MEAARWIATFATSISQIQWSQDLLNNHIFDKDFRIEIIHINTMLIIKVCIHIPNTVLLQSHFAWI